MVLIVGTASASEWAMWWAFEVAWATAWAKRLAPPRNTATNSGKTQKHIWRGYLGPL
jgi:hypothetical protein